MFWVLICYNKVKILWVPVHCEVEENKRTDLLARHCLNSEMFEPLPELGISKSSVISRLSLNILFIHQKRWSISPKYTLLPIKNLICN